MSAHFDDVLEAFVSRRRVIRGGLATVALALVGRSVSTAVAKAATAGEPLLGFKGVPVSTADDLVVPEGYTASLLYAWGDPISDGPEWKADASNDWRDQERQAGMHHDAIELFPLGPDRALLAVNHEYVDDGLLHVGGREPWTAEKVKKSQAAVGVSILEVVCKNGTWEVVRPSRFARRITATTPIRISGPAAGHDLLETEADRTGTRIWGTTNNCSGGRTPWGTYLTCEENFNEFFARLGDVPAPLKRYGIGAKSEYGWEKHDARFDAGAHPNEPNRFGWVVEIDPHDPASVPVKRTALGRMKHEGATVTLAKDKRVVVYMADDEAFEYIYKFVSKGAYRPDAVTQDLLDHGTLYVARFLPDGEGEWIELTHGKNGLDEKTGFASQAEVLIHARLAGDAVSATKMDRPECIAVSPKTGDVACALTNNKDRGADGKAPKDDVNPRVRNVYGHVIRWSETRGDAAATTFDWKVLLLAGDPQQPDDAKKGNIRGDAFGSPDGLSYDERGVLWIQTDVSPRSQLKDDYANLGNNQMLAVDPVTGEVRRFLTGPRFCEIAGIARTPDGRAMFVNIQHPGEVGDGPNDPARPGARSTWPGGPAVGRPRSATVVITKDDGGVVGT